MIVQFSPQRAPEGSTLHYDVDGDVIAVARDGQDAVLDLSGAQDGVWHDLEGNGLDDLGVLLSARRAGGVLRVRLLSLIGPGASEAERFPDPVELSGPATFDFSIGGA